MSHFPGPTLEDFVQDAFNFHVEIEYDLKVMELEPQRERIEQLLAGYDPDEIGWRDYRNTVFDWLDDIGEEVVEEIPRPDIGRKHWVDPEASITGE